MAPGESGGPGGPRGEDPRGVRLASRRGQVGGGRILAAAAARRAAADLLARRAWTRAELLARLQRRGAPEGVALEVVDDLTARGYVDDRAFAAQWVETRVRRGYGAARLCRELRARGVAGSLIDAALAAFSPARQLEQARAVARRRYLVLLRLAPARAAPRLRDHLMRRGFSPAVVSRVVRELASVTVDTE